jgi:hypothetical protein
MAKKHSTPQWTDADQVIRDTYAQPAEMDLDAEEAEDEEHLPWYEHAKQDTTPPEAALVTGGDLEAAWDQAEVGDETVGGSSPTPDQDIVEELGQALGLTYEDNEPLHTTEKVEQRDAQRWELDPASSEDYQERTRWLKED